MLSAIPMRTANYIGRFAPSPSGPLHFGSLVAAVGSFLQAKHVHGQWLLRIEDIDTTRVQPGADSAIMRSLEAFGLHWDGPVLYQSQRLSRYQDVFNQLLQAQRLYACECSRKDIAGLGGIYPGTCARLNLNQHRPPNTPLAWRLRATDVVPNFTDVVFGKQEIEQALAKEDYVIKRRDGLFSYQLVVVVDDADQKITEVIRGADLLSMTPRQQHLFNLLGWLPPRYGHLPLAVSAPGQKLSKQNHATPLTHWPLAQTLTAALTLLGHPPPAALQHAPVAEILHWATQHWQLANVPPIAEIYSPAFG